jgi:Yip1 domain
LQRWIAERYNSADSSEGLSMDNVVTPPPSGTPMSEPARIINTFIAPSKTFSDLQNNASWWGPFLLIVLVTLLYVAVMDRQIGFDQVSRNEIAKSPRRAEQMEKLPADQRAQQMKYSEIGTKYISYASPVIALIVYVIMAGVLLAVFKFGADAGVTFKIALAIVVYGSLPWLIHALLGMLSMLAGVDKEAFNIQNPVGTNPAYFMDPAGNKFVLGMASALDVFAIWSIALIGIGFACNSRVKRSTAIGLVAGLFLFWKLLGSGLAALFS